MRDSLICNQWASVLVMIVSIASYRLVSRRDQARVLEANAKLNTSANDSWKSLSSLSEVIESRAQNRTEFFEECRAGAFDGTLVIYRTFESVETTGRFDEEVIHALPESINFICHNGESAPEHPVNPDFCPAYGCYGRQSLVPSTSISCLTRCLPFRTRSRIRSGRRSRLLSKRYQGFQYTKRRQ